MYINEQHNTRLFDVLESSHNPHEGNLMDTDTKGKKIGPDDFFHVNPATGKQDLTGRQILDEFGFDLKKCSITVSNGSLIIHQPGCIPEGLALSEGHWGLVTSAPATT